MFRPPAPATITSAVCGTAGKAEDTTVDERRLLNLAHAYAHVLLSRDWLTEQDRLTETARKQVKAHLEKAAHLMEAVFTPPPELQGTVEIIPCESSEAATSQLGNE